MKHLCIKSQFIKSLSFLLIIAFALGGCSAANNKAQSAADSGVRFAAKRNIGKEYAKVAKKRDLTLERKPLIGKLVGSEKLSNGNTVYFHEMRQTSSSLPNIFGVVSVGKKQVRYDHVAYLVDAKGMIMDFAHRRSNTQYSSLGFGSGLVSVEKVGDEEKNNRIEGVDAYVTSKGGSIDSWK